MIDLLYYEKIDLQVVSLINRLLTVDKQAYYYFQILYATGARVSELENVPVWKIRMQDILEIPALKESNLRQIKVSTDPILSGLYVSNLEYYLTTYTAKKATYYVKKYVSRFHVRNTDLQPVTHLFRYLYIVRRLAAQDDITNIQKDLGHKVTQTTINYVSNLREANQ